MFHVKNPALGAPREKSQPHFTLLCLFSMKQVGIVHFNRHSTYVCTSALPPCHFPWQGCSPPPLEKLRIPQRKWL